MRSRSLLFLFTITRHLSSSSITSKLPNLSKIPSKYRERAVSEAQTALTDYLHTTRNLSFTFAEHISKNSLHSLSEIMALVDFSLSGYSRSLHKFFRYHPVNEFKFFYESIGVHFDQIDEFLCDGSSNSFFLDEGFRVYAVACGLWGFGFPWNRLGEIYRVERLVFDEDFRVINERLLGFKAYGFDNVMIIGMCLCFPWLLSGRSNEIGGLLDVFKRVFLDYDLVSFVEGNVDSWIEVCRKVRIFYELGCGKGDMGELMGRSRSVFVDYSEEVLVQKIEYFCRLDVSKAEIGYLLLSRPEILGFDLQSEYISVLGFLQYFGLDETKLKSVVKNYRYVMGRNRLANLPHVLKALNLNEWFFDKMRNGYHSLLGSYVIGCSKEESDEIYTNFSMGVPSKKMAFHTQCKLNFLHGIGFGENKFTIDILCRMRGSSSDLQERFDFLLHSGVEYAKLCKMISSAPHMLNQHKEQIEQKVKYLCKELGLSLQYLDIFPAYLCYNLDKRVKPRYRFYTWLRENGLCTREFTLPSIIATNEKVFISRAYRIHPAAPKRWLEGFLRKEDSCSYPLCLPQQKMTMPGNVLSDIRTVDDTDEPDLDAAAHIIESGVLTNTEIRPKKPATSTKSIGKQKPEVVKVQMKKMAPRSLMWTEGHYIQIKDKEGKVIQGKCVYCGKKIAASARNGTSSLRYHHRVCKKNPINIDKNQPELV